MPGAGGGPARAGAGGCCEGEQNVYLDGRRRAAAEPVPERIGAFDIDPTSGLWTFTGRRGTQGDAATLRAVARALEAKRGKGD